MLTQPANRWFVLLAVLLAFLPIVLDMTILHVAIPSLTLALGASGTEVLWIIDIYPLLMASLLIPMGTLADRVGHRRLLLLGLSLFLAGSVLAAFSPSAMALIATRALMALGAAMAMPCTLAIIRQTFLDGSERAMALGIWAAVGSAGAAIGPLVGGALLEHFWWGSVFLVNLPVMLLVLPLVALFTPRLAVLDKAPWAIGQAGMLMVGIMASIYAIKFGFQPGTTVVTTAAILLGGLGMLGRFVYLQLHSPTPVLDVGLFSRPPIASGVVMALVVMGSLAGVELMLAQELQFVLGRSPLQAGVFMLPLMIGSGVGGPCAGLILRVLGLRTVASLSLLVAAGSLAGLAGSDFGHASPGIIAMLTALGLSLGIGLTASSVAIMGSTPAEKAGSAGALEATSYDLGAGLGITGFGLLLAASYGRAIQVPDSIPADQAEAAARSIGEAFTIAQGLGGVQEVALLGAARLAFNASHSTVLMTAATLIAVLSVVIFFMLRADTGSDAASQAKHHR